MTTPSGDDDRIVRAEIEVPGTPEEVWAAIATGPGITAWFVPAAIEEREGGATRLHFGPLGDDEGTVTAWDPPLRVAFRGGDGVAHEVIVEARAGGTCLVRLVNRGFTSDWDDELDAIADGWRKYLGQLRLYRTRFPCARCASVFVTGSAERPPAEALAALAGALGIAATPAEGERIATTAHGVALAGTVRSADDQTIMLDLDEPAPGYGFLGTFSLGDRSAALARAYLFGDGAPEAARRAQQAWGAWMDERFPFVPPAEAA